MAVSGDQKLVKRTLSGDLEAFGELVQIYQASVFNVCYRTLGNRRDAEDLTQEAFLRAYNNIKSYDQERPFGPWMRTLAATAGELILAPIADPLALIFWFVGIIFGVVMFIKALKLTFPNKKETQHA